MWTRYAELVINGVRTVTGRHAVLAATGGHPYARLSTGNADELRGYVGPGVTAWTGVGPTGPVAGALGDASVAARLLAALAGAGRPPGIRRLHLPRAATARLAPYLTVAEQEDWEFRWATRPPPRVPADERVVELGRSDEPDITELLDRAHPDTTTRPGDPRVRVWYGVRAGDRLVACGADCGRGGVGFLSAITVDAAAQGQGLGTALTAAVARRLAAAYDCVALGVMAGNARAIGIYTRLGFAAVTERSSVALAGAGS
jgi:GNAT superfamily N-acetyltransferase